MHLCILEMKGKNMNYVNVEKLNTALAELGQFMTPDDMSMIERRLVQGIQDFYDKQSEKLADTDIKALGISVIDELAFDEAPF